MRGGSRTREAAVHMLFLLGQLFRAGELAHHAVFVNLKDGATQPNPADPQAWAAMMGVPTRGDGYH